MTASTLPSETGGQIFFSRAIVSVTTACALGIAAVAVISFALQGSGAAAFVAIGMLSLVAVLIPLLAKKRFDPFEPIVPFAFTVLMGCTLRSVMLAYSSEANYQTFVLTNGVPIAEIAANTWWVPISLALFSLGYMATERRLPIERVHGLVVDHWIRSRLFVGAALFVAVSLFATWRLAGATGVDLSNLLVVSRKRAVEVATSSGDIVYARHGYWLWLTSLAKVALFVLFADAITDTEKKRRRSLVGRVSVGIVLFLLSLMVIIWPLISSSRTGILQVAFGLVIIVTYLGFRGGYRFRKRRFIQLGALGVLFAVTVLVGVGIWRQVSQSGQILDVSPTQALLNNSVGSGNFMPLARTGLIAREMTRRGDWLYGQTYLNTVFAPVPRAIWPDKPMISVGLFVRTEIYGRPATTNGSPPGLLGEAFLNFSYIGILIIPIVAGMILRVFYNSFRPHLGRSKSATILYALILWPIGFQYAELNLSMIVIGVVTAFVPGFLLLSIVGRRSGLSARPLPA